MNPIYKYPEAEQYAVNQCTLDIMQKFVTAMMAQTRSKQYTEPYGFKPLDLGKLYGRDTYTYYEEGTVGHLTFFNEPITSAVVRLPNPNFVIEDLNEKYHNGVAYEFVNKVFRMSVNEKKPAYSVGKSTHYLDDKLWVLDVQNGQIVYDTGKAYHSNLHITNNILNRDDDYIFLPEKRLVISHYGKKQDYDICSYKTFTHSKYIAFGAYKGKCPNSRGEEVVIMLDTITGEIKEVL